MITKEDGLRYAKLVHVSVDNGQTGNSNKEYIMTELNDGRIECIYGRVGRNMTTVYKGSHEWDKIYKQKTSAKKGYKDITELIAEAVQDAKDSGKTVDAVDIADRVVKSLIDELMAFANKSIQQNYKVTQDSVTQAQVDKAQEYLDAVIGKLKIGVNIKDVNETLMELYITIPRRMDNVKDFLLEPINNQSDLDDCNEFISSEQDTLDTMAGQVKLVQQQKGTTDTDDSDDVQDQITILEQMGLDVSVETNKDSIALVHKLLGPNKNQAKKIFKVVNKKTQKIFDANLKKMKNKKRRLYWHGSRNENWFNIMQTGLMIRPSGAIHTGSMFGDGIYFADKAQKSLGYSSLRGSYWSGGSANKGFLALFDVHLGNQKEILHHNSSCYSLSQKKMDAEGYDSVFAKGGADLRNNEFIVYNGNRCTIAYIVEMQN